MSLNKSLKEKLFKNCHFLKNMSGKTCNKLINVLTKMFHFEMDRFLEDRLKVSQDSFVLCFNNFSFLVDFFLCFYLFTLQLIYNRINRIIMLISNLEKHNGVKYARMELF